MKTPQLSNMEIQKRSKGQAVICACCFHAVGHIQNGRLIVNGRHGSQIHTNMLTADDLELLAQLVRNSATMAGDKVA